MNIEGVKPECNVWMEHCVSITLYLFLFCIYISIHVSIYTFCLWCRMKILRAEMQMFDVNSVYLLQLNLMSHCICFCVV